MVASAGVYGVLVVVDRASVGLYRVAVVLYSAFAWLVARSLSSLASLQGHAWLLLQHGTGPT